MVYVLRRDDDNVLRRVLDFEVDGPRKSGRPKKMCKNQVEDEIKRVGHMKEDSTDIIKWAV